MTAPVFAERPMRPVFTPTVSYHDGVPTLDDRVEYDEPAHAFVIERNGTTRTLTTRLDVAPYWWGDPVAADEVTSDELAFPVTLVTLLGGNLRPAPERFYTGRQAPWK